MLSIKPIACTHMHAKIIYITVCNFKDPGAHGLPMGCTWFKINNSYVITCSYFIVSTNFEDLTKISRHSIIIAINKKRYEI